MLLNFGQASYLSTEILFAKVTEDSEETVAPSTHQCVIYSVTLQRKSFSYKYIFVQLFQFYLRISSIDSAQAYPVTLSFV